MTTTDTAIRIDRVLPATIDRVYAAWTRPELLSQWYCPNPDLEIEVRTDLRIGGEYVVKMGPYVVRGVYTELDPPNLIGFTWQWDETDSKPSQVRVELTTVAEGTRMLLSHTGLENAEDVANHLQGWEGNLGRLPAFLESLADDRA